MYSNYPGLAILRYITYQKNCIVHLKYIWLLFVFKKRPYIGETVEYMLYEHKSRAPRMRTRGMGQREGRGAVEDRGSTKTKQNPLCYMLIILSLNIKNVANIILKIQYTRNPPGRLPVLLQRVVE